MLPGKTIKMRSMLNQTPLSTVACLAPDSSSSQLVFGGQQQAAPEAASPPLSSLLLPSKGGGARDGWMGRDKPAQELGKQRQWVQITLHRPVCCGFA